MGSETPRRRVWRKTTIESLEDRQMFSADPVGGLLGGVQHHAIEEPVTALHSAPSLEQHSAGTPDFWYDLGLDRGVDQQLGDVEQTLASAHGVTGLNQARQSYGFTGLGQTVVVIDSGIAYDHAALGGGYGANYRVVGGWDFTEESDANPYDDGPAGSHGTHVAGIVGADTTGTTGDGVAPGVDLVGLRVFNDQGAGYFSWVEKALKWVHTNRGAFENPITAINLSLGTSWNSASVPSWAMLEDEFAQLEADGIFISVSAGNSFASYNSAGLSYPAASSHVVPVMSLDDNGQLSYFSQRHTRAIAAPGRSILSTVPDYVGNQNGITDDWANYSGTSMAAPYVAGASVIVREAMQFVGMTNITQWTIYDHMMATADSFVDAATNLAYKRLNLARAIDALMPSDDYGSTAAEAHGLGAVGHSGADVSGVIGKLDDADYFRFTASATGTATFTIDTTHTMKAAWIGEGVAEANSYTLDVVAGQSYTFGISSTGGVGYYDVTVGIESAFSSADWGAIAQWQSGSLSVSGDAWYRVEASQAGFLTAEALFSGDGGSVALAWYDANMRLVASGVGATGGERVDHVVGAGESLYLRATGNSANVEFRITNLVSQVGSTVAVAGTGGDDKLAFAAGAEGHTVAVNGVTYNFAAADASSFSFRGGGGNDAITMTGTAGSDTATLRAGESTLAGAGYAASASGFAKVAVHGGGGNDQATFFDSAGDDVYAAWSTQAVMYGSGYFNDARGFGRTTAHATAGGYDRAVMYDTAGDDVYAAWSTQAVLYGNGYFNDARGFDRTTAHATAGGYDRAVLYDTAGNDIYAAWSTQAVLYGNGYFNEARDFDRTTAHATAGGFDRAVFYDTAGDDVYAAWSTQAALYGDGYFNDARGFDRTTAHATGGGFDRAVLYDSSGSDTAVARAWGAYMEGSGFCNEACGFEKATSLFVNGGTDEADVETVDYVFDLVGQWSQKTRST